MDIVALEKLGEVNYPGERIHRPTAGPGEFLTIISKAEMVITDSYHGMLFSINYHKSSGRWSVHILSMISHRVS